MSPKVVTTSIDFRRSYQLLAFIVAVFSLSSCLKVGKSTRRAATPYNPQGATANPPGSSGQFPVLTQPGDIYGTNFATRFPLHSSANSQVAVMENGEDFLSVRMAMLNQAKKSVLIQTLIWRGNESGWAVAEKLVELHNRGIKVEIIVDPLSSLLPGDQGVLAHMAAMGIPIQGFAPLYGGVLNKIVTGRSDIENLLNDANARYHEKFFVVDHELGDQAYAIIGGTNIGNEYFRMNPEDQDLHWTDKDVVLRGPIIQDIVRSFNDNMVEYAANNISSDGGTITSVLATLQGMIFDKDSNPTIEARISQTVNQSNVLQGLVWHPASMRFIQSRPRRSEKYIFQTYIDMIKNSQEEILIANSYFLPSIEFQNELINAITRGVKVKILTNSKEVTDFPALVTAARVLYKRLLDANPVATSSAEKLLEIYEWSGREREGLYHSKFGVFDRKASIVGSYNIDPRSKNFNSESIVVFESIPATLQIVNEFYRHIAPKYSNNISVQQAAEFRDPSDFIDQIETRFLEKLTPLL